MTSPQDRYLITQQSRLAYERVQHTRVQTRQLVDDSRVRCAASLEALGPAGARRSRRSSA